MYKLVFPPDRPENFILGRAAEAWGLGVLEVRVLGEVARGLDNKEVAQGVGRALKTVERYVSRLLSKSRSSSRAMLVARFWAGFGRCGQCVGEIPLAAE